MKLSPLTIPYRIVRRGASVAVTLLFLVATGSSVFGGVVGALSGVGLIVLGFLALSAYEAAYWRRYEYDLTPDTFDIRSGVISRREREIPLRRIQNVDIRRNVVQRLLDIAAVDLETAGGGGTEAAIRFVPFPEAKRLQREIADLKRDAAPDETAPEPEPLFELSSNELALVGALSFDVRLPGLLLFLLSGSATAVPSVLGVPIGRAEAVALAGVGAVVLVAVALVSWGIGAAVAVNNYYGFRLTRVGDELQYERGLLRRYDGSIPLDKIQTLTVTDNPLKRHFGYASLYIETAGHVSDRSDGRRGSRGSQAAVPLARVERVEALAREIEPFGDPDLERPPGRVRRRYVARYLLAIGGLVGLLFGVERVVDVGLPWYGPLAVLPVLVAGAHLKWRHRGYWLGDDHLLTRNGVLRRRTKVVPYYRIQTVIDSRTVFQRRWGLGTVTADTAGSLSIIGADAAAVDVDRATADRLREALVDRLRAALAAHGRDRGWRWGDVEGLSPEGTGRGDEVRAAGTDGPATDDVTAPDGDPGPGDDPPSNPGSPGSE